MSTTASTKTPRAGAKLYNGKSFLLTGRAYSHSGENGSARLRRLPSRDALLASADAVLDASEEPPAARGLRRLWGCGVSGPSAGPSVARRSAAAAASASARCASALALALAAAIRSSAVRTAKPTAACAVAIAPAVASSMPASISS